MERIQLSVAASAVCRPTKVCELTIKILNEYKNKPGFIQVLGNNI